MDFIKLQAEEVFDGKRLLGEKVLVLRTDGTVEAITEAVNAGDDVQYVEGMLSPGFINCHCHLELSHLRAQIAENTGLAGFVQEVVTRRAANEEEVQQAIADAVDEMRQNGIVAVGDICNTTKTIAQKANGHLYFHNFIEVLGFDPAIAQKNFDLFEKIFLDFIEKLPAARSSLTLHAPYSISDELWQKTVCYPDNDIISIHNQETPDENLWFEKKEGAFADMYRRMKLDTAHFIPSGKTSLQTYGSRFLPDQSLTLVHNVHTSQADIDFTKTLPNKIFWCLCPHANEYISRTLPDVKMFLANNCTVVLGTDSLASNHQLSIWEEIKLLRKHFPDIMLEEMLRWATLNGAQALKIDATYGSFEKGKKPGVVQLVVNKAKTLM
ncbi:MAG: amidohydrolase family protein [Niabella sp.]